MPHPAGTSEPSAGVSPRPADFEELAGRLFLVGFLSVLVYLPPRIFYLADDAGRPASRLTIVLAVSPIVLHVVLGVI